MHEDVACENFLRALDDKKFAARISERDPKNLDDALKIAIKLEALDLSLVEPVHRGQMLTRECRDPAPLPRNNLGSGGGYPSYEQVQSQFTATLQQQVESTKRMEETIRLQG